MSPKHEPNYLKHSGWIEGKMSSGIGRGLKSSAQQDDIFVFGYACKLFRDDSK